MAGMAMATFQFRNKTPNRDLISAVEPVWSSSEGPMGLEGSDAVGLSMIGRGLGVSQLRHETSMCDRFGRFAYDPGRAWADRHFHASRLENAALKIGEI